MDSYSARLKRSPASPCKTGTQPRARSGSSSSDRFIPYYDPGSLSIDARSFELQRQRDSQSTKSTSSSSTTTNSTAAAVVPAPLPVDTDTTEPMVGSINSAIHRQVLWNELFGDTQSSSTTSTTASATSSSAMTATQQQAASLFLPTSPLKKSRCLGIGGCGDGGGSAAGLPNSSQTSGPITSPYRRLLTYNKPTTEDQSTCSPTTTAADQRVLSMSTLSEASQQLLLSSGVTNMCRRAAEIDTKPFKVLEAPGLVDDFYTCALDWNAANVVALALPQTVYLWNASTTTTTEVRDPSTTNETMEDDEDDDEEEEKGHLKSANASVCWRPFAPETLTIGKRSGVVQMVDVSVGMPNCQQVDMHTKRVGALAWSPRGDLLATGSKDEAICLYDPRTAQQSCVASAHEQEICGLKWEPIDGNLLASGGNDNMLYVWDKRRIDDGKPLFSFDQHKAAVKAMAWSPHHKGLLASGGGTADRHLKFWDTSATGEMVDDIDTGSQVCMLHWSANRDEIVSSHGYSQNHIVVWDAVTRSPITALRGHTARVLHMAVSPDGRTLVTGAGDATLRFWHVFPPRQSMSSSSSTSSSHKMPGFSLDLR